MSEAIVRLAARGDGVTTTGRFVPGTAPGDLLLADGGVTPGPRRQAPPCPHFPACGGCRLQHVDDAAYADFLVGRITEALRAQGVAPGVVRPPHLSPPRSRRRAGLKAQRRGAAVLIGFHEEGSHRIVDMRECHVLRPELFALVAPLRGLLRNLIGPRGAADIRMTLADQGVDLLLGGVDIAGLAAAEAATDFAQDHGLARLAIDDGLGPQTLWEPEPATISLSGIPVALPHDAFLQATADGEAALVAAVREATQGAGTIADLFAGLGTFALALGGRVYAAEGARAALLALKGAADRRQRPVFVDHRDLFRRPLTTAELNRFDAVVLDSPRAGARDQVAQLAAAAVPRIVYVSCNPATFARDAQMLAAGGLHLSWVQPVGQFRWSTHVELVAAFARQDTPEAS